MSDLNINDEVEAALRESILDLRAIKEAQPSISKQAHVDSAIARLEEARPKIIALKQRKDWYPQKDQKMEVDPKVRARTLLTYLYRIFDSGGISLGRSHESILLETAMELLGPADPEDVHHRDYGTNVMEARNYLSDQIAKELGLDDLGLPPPNEAHRR